MRALDVGAAWAAAAAGPSVQLEARVDGCRPVLWGGRRRVTALLPPPARQLRHRHPDRGARRVAALPRRAEGDAVVGWPARPPQQGHAGVHRQPAPLAGGGAAARLRAGTEPGGGAVEQSQGQGRRACQPHRPDAGGGDRPSPAWHPAGPSDPVPGVLVPASNRPIGLLDLVTVSTQLPRPVRLGPGDRRTGAPPPIERAGNASTAGPSPWVADGHPFSASHTLANAAAKSWST